jgi:hypothetical protein
MSDLKLPASDLYVGDVKIFNANGTIVTSVTIADNAITTAKILNDAVTTAKILEKNVTTAQLADDIQVGSLATLTTTEVASVVGAINEVDANADAAAAAAAANLVKIGTIGNLTTTEKTNLVGAINEIDAANASMITLTGTQTLTNKTLTTPIISDGDAGLTITSADQTNASAIATVPNIGDAADSFVMNDTAATLTNKHLTSPHLTTPLIEDSDTGISITSANQTHASPTVTIPDIVDAADTFVVADTAQTLTNKTLTSPTLTTPKIVTTGHIDDAGGAAYLTFVESTTPLNSIQITQGDTTIKPIIAAIGETNIGLALQGKGTGKVTITDAATPTKQMNFELVGATATKIMTITSSHTNDRTLTLPDATDTLVGKATTDALTNKTLTLPVIASLYQDAGNTLLLTMPAATDTLVGKATTDTLTNKTLTSPLLTTPKIDDGHQHLTITSVNQTDSAATATVPNLGDSADTFVMADVTQTLTNKTLTSPVFGGNVVMGTSGTPVVDDDADTKFISIYTDCGATSGEARGIYCKLNGTGAGGSITAGRFFAYVPDVAQADARGAHISVDLGTSGTVTGSGQALTTTLMLSAAATQAGTLSAITAEVYSPDAATDPSGCSLAVMRFSNVGLAKDDVDDDCVAFYWDSGWSNATAKMIAKADTPTTIAGNVNYTVKVRMPDGALGYIPIMASAVTDT